MVRGEDPRWAWRGPASAGLARHVQDTTGQLRERSATGFVSLTLAGQAPSALLRGGVASPTAAMMRDRTQLYDEPPSDDQLAAFRVDVPLRGDGGIGLVYPGRQESGTLWAVEAADADEVARLIRGGGYQAESQVVQFLAAPRTEEQYEVFAGQAQEVADRLRRDVYIVGAAGATVNYHEDPDASAKDHKDSSAFVAVRDGQAVAWRLLTPRDLVSLLGPVTPQLLDDIATGAVVLPAGGVPAGDVPGVGLVAGPAGERLSAGVAGLRLRGVEPGPEAAYAVALRAGLVPVTGEPGGHPAFGEPLMARLPLTPRDLVSLLGPVTPQLLDDIATGAVVLRAGGVPAGACRPGTCRGSGWWRARRVRGSARGWRCCS